MKEYPFRLVKFPVSAPSSAPPGMERTFEQLRFLQTERPSKARVVIQWLELFVGHCGWRARPERGPR